LQWFYPTPKAARIHLVFAGILISTAADAIALERKFSTISFLDDGCNLLFRQVAPAGNVFLNRKSASTGQARIGNTTQD
jgi:hypothetical protein